jgi:uncharacterized protein
MPGFCAKGIGSAEAKVCGHPGSAESEGLIYAMYRAALEKIDAGAGKTLQEQHTKWWDGVKQCADAKDMTTCINNAYGTRAMQLQTAYKVTKAKGPVKNTCCCAASQVTTASPTATAANSSRNRMARSPSSGARTPRN